MLSSDAILACLAFGDKVLVLGKKIVGKHALQFGCSSFNIYTTCGLTIFKSH
jgi:hypothetical protein